MTGRSNGQPATAEGRADPGVQEALASARVLDLVQPTLKDGESSDDLLAARSAYEDFDAQPYFNGRGFGFVRGRE